jgi:acetyl-CoA synthetase
MMEQPDTSFQSLLHELRVIPPPEEFAAKAHIRSLEEYDALYRRSVENPEEFWSAAANELHWFEPWTKVLEWNEPGPSGGARTG